VKGTAHVVTIVGLALSPLMVSWMCDSGVLLAEERYRGMALLRVSQPLVYVVLVLVLALTGHLSVASTLLAMVIGTAVTALLGWVLNPQGIRGPRMPLGELLTGSRRFAGNFAAEAATNRLDQAVALPMIGAGPSGLYAVAVTIASAPIALAHALGASYFNSVGVAEGEERRRLKASALRGGLAFGAVVSAVLAALTPPLVPLVFGSEFAAAVPATLVALTGTAFLMAGFVVSMCLAADNQGWRMTVAQVASLVVGLLLLVFLGPALGAVGAALASSLAYLVLYLVLFHASGVSIRDVRRAGGGLRTTLTRITASGGLRTPGSVRSAKGDG
jgi:O-antigen/teichoic acid export membrane protein